MSGGNNGAGATRKSMGNLELVESGVSAEDGQVDVFLFVILVITALRKTVGVDGHNLFFIRLG